MQRAYIWEMSRKVKIWENEYKTEEKIVKVRGLDKFPLAWWYLSTLAHNPEIYTYIYVYIL